jgi:hypothetical protein
LNLKQEIQIQIQIQMEKLTFTQVIFSCCLQKNLVDFYIITQHPLRAESYPFRLVCFPACGLGGGTGNFAFGLIARFDPVWEFCAGPFLFLSFVLSLFFDKSLTSAFLKNIILEHI